MNISIRAQGFELTDSIDQFVHDQLHANLARINEDMYAAIRKSIKRTKRAVCRQLRKSQRFARRRMREVLSAHR